MPWADVATGAVKSLGPSAGQFASDIAQPILHPIETAKTLAALGRGVLEKIVPGDQGWSADEKTADMVGKFFLDRYGSIEGIKKTIATDPVGMLADVSMVLTGGGAVAARAPGLVGKAGRVVRTAGRVSDPLSIAGRAVKLGATKVIGPLASNLFGLSTGAGAESIRGAARAGAAGGAPAEAFLSNLRGRVSPETVVADASAALDKMRQERGRAYREGMGGVKADQTVLDFGPIDDALREVSEIGVYKGKTLNKSTAVVWKKIAETIDDWRMSDPGAFHTAEGLDALKKAIGDIRDTTDFNTPSRVMADQVYNAIKAQIVKQAPDYAKVMKNYQTASDLLTEVQRSLSLGKKTAADTALRKLQSVMRNNANTNYGNRVRHAQMLEKTGATDLMAKLSGQSLSSPTPRGLQGAVAIPTALGTAAINPWLLPGMAATSPRLVGEAAYYTGKAGRGAGNLAGKLGPRKTRALGQGLFQVGRIGEEDQRRRRLVDALRRLSLSQ
jgi:hypothetical protein